GALTDSATASEFVGRIDSADVYRFSISQPGEVRVNITNPTNGNALVDVIRDINNNGVINSGETLATLSTGHILDGVVLPVTGNNYYVRVRPKGSSDVNYSMTLNFSKQTPFNGAPFAISNTAANNRIEAEDFDNGGDPDAYHDLDPADGPSAGVNFRSNDGVDLRNTSDPQGGQLRLATTKVGEFLEYTVNVLQTDVYDFEFRVSNVGTGGKLHIEVDGANVTGNVDVPNTGNVDAMTTVTSPVSSIPLSAGPHLLRLAFDGVSTSTPNIAGSVNFMNIRAASVSSGTFSLSPGAGSVHVGQDIKLALSWTVPDGASWHTLKNVKLRFVDPDDGHTILWINYQEATNTFQLYDPKANTYSSSAAAGTHTVLANRFAELRLAKSSVHADSPLSSTVTLTLDIVFHQPSRKRHLRAEAAASDDAGHVQGFDLAGTLDVLA
ncbi:MAG TPA: carbohydrate-binding protein, partial [Tepidisphaeraceae bacterium]